MIDRLRMQTNDLSLDKIQVIDEYFTNCIVSVDGVKQVDFDLLKQELSDHILNDEKEKYQFIWPDKSKYRRFAKESTNSTLRFCENEGVDCNNTKNIYIEGDNLEVLKILHETYLGKIKMIYIDPPYNTGSDFVYNDDYKITEEDYSVISGESDSEGNRLFENKKSNGRFHTDWLNMIYPRLILAKDFLTEDGAIFISIDDNEYANLKKICDEIFGESNFISNIVWQSTAGSNTGSGIVTVTENILIYAKNKNKVKLEGQLSDDSQYTLEDDYFETRGKYSLDKLDRRRVGSHYSDALNYPIEMPDGSIRYPGGTDYKSTEGWNYLWSKTKVDWGIKEGFIVFKETDNGWNVYNKRYSKIDNEGNIVERTVPFRNLILSNQFNTAQGTSELRTLFGSRPFDFPKPSKLIQYLIMMVARTDENAIIMDFFSGSASTAQAVMTINKELGGKRRFILVQIPSPTPVDSEAYSSGYLNICDIGKERIRRVGRDIKNSHVLGNDVDVGFRVFKCDSSNVKDAYYHPDKIKRETLDDYIDIVKEDRTSDDLLIQIMLELGIELSSSIERKIIDGHVVFSVDDGYLIACFDDSIDDSTVIDISKNMSGCMYVVFRSGSSMSDEMLANVEQVFRTYSPQTKIHIF